MTQLRSLLRIERWAFAFVLIFAIGYLAYDNLASGANKTTLPQSAQTPHVETELKDRIVEFSESLLGTPYVAAGCSKDGFDCSGFVFFVFQNFDIKVPRSSAEFEHYGKEIPIEKVEKGDLLLFLSPTRDVIGHMGIVSNPKGMQSDFIHATSGRQMKVVVTSLTNAGYKARFVKAVRVL